MIEIQHINRAKNGLFRAESAGELAGRMTYTWIDAHTFSIDHTIVEEAFGGKGIGKQLVMAGVEYARANQLKIVPICPYAKSLFDKMPEELADVLAA